MKTPFERAFARLLDEEKGFVNDPRDPGGATNMGVTLKTLREVGWDINGDGTIDVDDVRDLHPEQAQKIARSRYWDRCECERMPSLVGELVFDFAYHSGPTTAIKKLQKACGIAEDGVVGNDTLNATMRLSADEMAARYLAERNLYMVNAINPENGQPLFPIYGRGWSRRLFRLSMDIARVV
jgi:lysozyme family protein